MGRAACKCREILTVCMCVLCPVAKAHSKRQAPSCTVPFRINIPNILNTNRAFHRQYTAASAWQSLAT